LIDPGKTRTAKDVLAAIVKSFLKQCGILKLTVAAIYMSKVTPIYIWDNISG
jgi:hypothetical protein